MLYNSLLVKLIIKKKFMLTEFYLKLLQTIPDSIKDLNVLRVCSSGVFDEVMFEKYPQSFLLILKRILTTVGN